MKNRDFKIDIKTVWFLVIGNFLLTIFGASAKIQHWEYSQFFLTVGLMLFFSTWIIILSDMIKNKTEHIIAELAMVNGVVLFCNRLPINTHIAKLMYTATIIP